MDYKVHRKVEWEESWGEPVFQTDDVISALEKAEFFEREGHYAMIENADGDRYDVAGYRIEEDDE